LEQNSGVVGIENCLESHILGAWQEDFEKLGVRSVLLCSRIGTGNKEQEESIIRNQGGLYNLPEGLVIIGFETPRSWSRNERELVKIASQQLGFLLHQRHINQIINNQQQYTQYLQSGLTILQPTTILANPTKVLINSSNSLLLQEVKNLEPVGELSVLGNLSLDRLERNFLEFIAQAIVEITKINSQTIPLVALITWYPVSQTGRIMSYSYAESNITSTDKISIPVRTDSWIKQIISTNGWLHLSVSDVPAKTLRWLNILHSGQVVATALRTAVEHQPTGILLLADPHKILWQKTQVPQSQNSPTETLKNLLTHLVNQFAWSRRYLIVKTTLESQREELEWLNWYKQRRLEELYRTVGSGVKQLSELHYTPSENPAQQKNVLTNLRYQQLLRQIGNVLSSTTSLLKQEKWRLQANFDVVSVANLLRRSLIRIDSQVKKRQLQLEVHREGNLNIYGDSIKLELVVYELLISACRRSQTGGKIDIKCQTLDEEWLEFSIIDGGKISSKLIAEFNSVSIPDILEPSPLVSPPGKHLIICRRVIQQMGGELKLDLQKSGLVKSKLLLPLAHL
ncbi:MAG: histidine kinase, partial [Okeania sp. SIO3C4]|nr:histidine kinase [Okeania sp. SIO3C4]